MTVQEALQYAIQRHQAGNIGEALQVYRQILGVEPQNADALHLLGVAEHQVGQSAAGVEKIRRAISFNSNHPDYHINLGVILVSLGKLDEGLSCQRRALEISPDNANAYGNLGYTLQEMDQLDDAIAAGLQSVAIDPSQAGAHNNLGTAYVAANDFAYAEMCFRYAIQVNPSFPDAHNNLGKVLYLTGRVDEAIASIQQAIALKPNYPEAHNNLGNALCDKEQWEKAINCVRHALLLRPDYPAGHWNLGLMLLRQGDFERGWPEYDWRFRVPRLNPRQNFTQPWWEGDNLGGRAILIHAEQGFGDTIQFVRYLPEVAARGAKVILAAQPELLPLLKDFPGVAQLVSMAEPLPPFDFHCPLVSLPRVFKTTLRNIPPAIPYLRAGAAAAAAWATRLKSDRPKIGLAWAGKREHTNNHNRSFALNTYQPLAKLCHAQFVSLQKGGDTSSAPFAVSDWTEELTDFAATAALVANLDLVITADTSVAHLAGALGKPVWVMLPACPDWRWMLKRSDTPWYPTMKLLRQKKAGDWSAPIAEAENALRALHYDR